MDILKNKNRLIVAIAVSTLTFIGVMIGARFSPDLGLGTCVAIGLVMAITMNLDFKNYALAFLVSPFSIVTVLYYTVLPALDQIAPPILGGSLGYFIAEELTMRILARHQVQTSNQAN